jgi:hypothetical protein
MRMGSLQAAMLLMFSWTCWTSHPLKLMPVSNMSCNPCSGIPNTIVHIKVSASLSCIQNICNCFICFAVKKDFELARRLGGKGRPW